MSYNLVMYRKNVAMTCLRNVVIVSNTNVAMAFKKIPT